MMKMFGGNMLYAFVSFAGLVLVVLIRPKAVTHIHQVDNAPLHHVAMPDSMSSSPLVVALDPRVDEQVVQDQMQTTIDPDVAPEEPVVPTAETAAKDEPEGAVKSEAVAELEGEEINRP